MTWIALDIPTLIAGIPASFTGFGQVIAAIVIKEDWRTRLQHKNTRHLPAFEHLRKGFSRRQIVNRRQCKSLTNVIIAVTLFGGIVQAVLRNVAKIVSVPRGINRMCERVATQ